MYRLFFDIEPKSKDKDVIIPIEKLTKYIRRNLNDCFSSAYGWLVELTVVSDSTGKQKFRIYTDFAMRMSHMN